MSRAFVKESDGGDVGHLPELRISPHRNLVTPAGLRQIETMVERLQSELSAARTADDPAVISRIQRDLRYWSERQRTAEAIALPGDSDKVRFGSVVTLRTSGGRKFGYQVVGEDEADPAAGRISYVSPIARLLIGSSAGDVLRLAGEDATILSIS